METRPSWKLSVIIFRLLPSSIALYTSGEKLREIGFPSHALHEYVAAIFEKRIGITYQNGLVECQYVEEFDMCLEGLKILWNSREKTYAPSSGP